jgi:uridylate kinase
MIKVMVVKLSGNILQYNGSGIQSKILKRILKLVQLKNLFRILSRFLSAGEFQTAV